MENILIAAGGDKHIAALTMQLKEVYPSAKISAAMTGRETRRALTERDYDAVIVDCPLPDEFGNEIAELTVNSTGALCVLLVKSESADIMAERAEDYGALVISKPLNKLVFYRAMRFVGAARKRMLGIQSENIKLQKKLEEIRLVNRAKLALMQYLGFTEQQAHRYIEKQAMDLRCTKLEVAKKVIKMYEV